MQFPKVIKVRQDFPRPRVEDVGEALREQCAKEEIRTRIEPGAEVAITAGSRGVAGIDNVLRSLVRILSRSEERRVGKECRSLCDWSSDVCSSDLDKDPDRARGGGRNHRR